MDLQPLRLHLQGVSADIDGAAEHIATPLCCSSAIVQSRRQFSACTPVVRFGNFIGEPYEIGATEHIARISVKWCYRAHCIATLCEALAVWWSFLTTSAFGIERLDNSPHQGTSAPLHFVNAKFHLLDGIAIPFSFCKHGSSLSGGAQPSRASFCSSSTYRLHAHGRRKATTTGVCHCFTTS